MCGRYVTPEQAAIERAWNLRAVPAAHFHKNTFDNVDASPTQLVPLLRVARDSGGAKELVEARWGFIPHWAHGELPRDSRTGRPLTTFNAKIETLRASPTYRDAWSRGQRCLIPARGFYEWQAQPPDWQRTARYYITVTDQDFFCLAGLWGRSRKSDGTVIDSVTVITIPANELMVQIHNSSKRGPRRALLPERERRMPVILRGEDQDVWLTGTTEEASTVLRPYAAAGMVAVPVDGPVPATQDSAAKSLDINKNSEEANH